MKEQMDLFEDGGLKDEGGMVDKESGNDVPVGSTKKEVRDDIPAMLSEGEFVLPADVVRYHGLEKIMQLRDEAKFGLKKMEAMGQMGNSEEATLDDDIPFGPADLVIVGAEPMEGEEEPRKMAQGGMIYAQKGTFLPETGIAGTQASYFDEVEVEPIYTPPLSSIAPPSEEAPEGGYRPLFTQQSTTGTDTGTETETDTDTGTGTQDIDTTTGDTSTIDDILETTTVDDFFETVSDVFKTVEYINPETGEKRTFSFYRGEPIGDIPEGFIPLSVYEAQQEETDDLESTTVETARVRGNDNDDDIFRNLPKTEAVDYSKLNKDELLSAFDENKKARVVLTGLGLVNPIVGLFGHFATSHQEKRIIAEMEKRGIKPPETTNNMIDSITDMISGVFQKPKEEVKKVIETPPSGSGSTPTPTYTNYFTEAIRAREQTSNAAKIQKAKEEASNILAASTSSDVIKRAEETGRTPVQVAANTSSNNNDKPTFAGDDYDPRGPNQSGTPGRDNSTVSAVNRAANEAAAQAEEEQQAAGNVESYEKTIQRGGGFKQGGLVSRKKKKK